jgi:hypothetical protein
MVSDGSSILNDILDDLIADLNSNFLTLLYAIALYQTEPNTIGLYSDDVSISPKIGLNLHVEPISIRTLKQFKLSLPDFLVEQSHARLVRLWTHCLSDLYASLIDLHFSGTRDFRTLKKQRIGFDLNSTSSTLDQIKEELVSNFGFIEFNDRQRIIDRELNPDRKGEEALRQISKNVHIRNAIEHRKGVMDAYILKKLGCVEIDILDNEGHELHCRNGDIVSVSIPEIHSLMSSIQIMQQIWRGW